MMNVPLSHWPGGRGLAGLLVWVPAVLAGLLTLLLASRERRWGRGALGSIRSAVLRRSKRRVAALFGPPRTALVRGMVPSAPADASFWQADTWYYPLGGSAMAIEFSRGVARRVDFIEMPSLPK